jgi:hypothetical protein
VVVRPEGATELVAALVFLTPLGGLVAVALVLPLAALTLAARRERRARELLGLAAPPRARRVPRLLVLAAVPALLGVAATQPALRSETSLRIRTDAQVFYVLDTSRSMLASRGPRAPTRLARAKADAIAIRNALPEFPSGVATFTDRILPDLLPDDDPAVFDSTVRHAVAIEEPPPSMQSVVATTLGALGALGTQNFFPAAVKKRLVVLLTDGESDPFDAPQVARALASGPGIKLILIHVWAPNETVYDQGRPESAYHENDASGELLASLASATGGHLDGEGEVGSAIATAKADLGRGPSIIQGQTERTRSLATYVALVALLPLLFIVWPASFGIVRRPSAAARTRIAGVRPAAGAPGGAPGEEGSVLSSR